MPDGTPSQDYVIKTDGGDFRIKADGSAIEPVSGDVSGLGFTFTEAGDCFVSTVGWPAHLVAPLPWHSLARNPFDGRRLNTRLLREQAGGGARSNH